VQLHEANALIEPGHRALETGYLRLPDGQLHVAALTSMPGCSGAMFEWWFGFLETTEQYKRWHPKDHVWCEWVGERGTGRFVGGTHNVHEHIGGELHKLRIHFREPAEYLAADRFADAGITAAVCGRVGLLEAPLWTGHVIHLCRDTDYGCELRSRFWIGDMDPPPPGFDRDARLQLFPDSLGASLLKHCHEEMTYLAGFLPELFAEQGPGPR